MNKKITFSKTWINGIAAGVALSIAGAASIMCSAGIENQSVATLVKSAIFPMGLMLIVFSGFSLFTGNVYNFARVPKMSLSRYIALLTCNWFANFLGAFCISLAIAMTCKNVYPEVFATIAENKIAPDPLLLLSSGIFANMCVCLAVALAQKAQTLIAKALCIFIPVSFFVCMGWEHSIANMFYLPYGILMGANITVGQAIFFNLVPVTVGNIIGGIIILLLVSYNAKSET